MIRRATKGGVEQDVFTGWRRMYCYTQRPGLCAKVKRNARRRERRQSKIDIRKDTA